MIVECQQTEILTGSTFNLFVLILDTWFALIMHKSIVNTSSKCIPQCLNVNI